MHGLCLLGGLEELCEEGKVQTELLVTRVLRQLGLFRCRQEGPGGEQEHARHGAAVLTAEDLGIHHLDDVDCVVALLGGPEGYGRAMGMTLRLKLRLILVPDIECEHGADSALHFHKNLGHLLPEVVRVLAVGDLEDKGWRPHAVVAILAFGRRLECRGTGAA